MKKVSDLLSGEMIMELDHIEYNSKKIVSGQVSVHYHDSVKIIKWDGTKLILLFTRKILLEPEALFELEVSYRVEHTLKSNDLNIEEYNLREEIKNTPENFLGDIGHISLLISQITGTFGRSPLVTPPVVYSDELIFEN